MSRARPLDLGPLVTLIGFFLRRAQLVVYEDFLRDAPIPLTPGQLGVLIVIEHNPEMMQQDLCEAIGVDKSTFTSTLDGLADRKLIRRVRSREDRRCNSLRLTAKGKAALEAMLAHVARHEGRVFASLSPSERAQLMKLLRKVAGWSPRS